MKLPAQTRRNLAIFAFLLVAVFLVINRPAYTRAFFTADDLDNLANARESSWLDAVKALARPTVLGLGNYRAAAAVYYVALWPIAGLHFAPYIAVIHAIHLLNVFLIWWLARSLGAEPLGSSAAALFYAFNAAVFDIYWKPMYVFDLLCATYLLASFLLYARGRWILALPLFWLALRSKELAIAFPLVLAAYELAKGSRRWSRLALFFAISAIIGIQALASNPNVDNDYSLRFTWRALRDTSLFYARRLAGLPYIGFSVLIIPFLTRSRRVALGVATFLLLLAPMLFLPGRLFGAYLYVPLIGLAIALSAATRPARLAAFFLVWISWNFIQFRDARREALALADETRIWFNPLSDYMRSHPETGTLIWDGAPLSMPPYAIAGLARLFRDDGVRVAWIEDPQGALDAPDLAVLVWDSGRRKLYITPRRPDDTYIKMDQTAPAWQLTRGWHGHQEGFRWIAPNAAVRLHKPAGARTFEVKVNVSQFDNEHVGRLDLKLNGAPLGTSTLNNPTPTKFRFDVASSPEAIVEIEFSVTPPVEHGTLGQPIAEFGFP